MKNFLKTTILSLVIVFTMTTTITSCSSDSVETLSVEQPVTTTEITLNETFDGNKYFDDNYGLEVHNDGASNYFFIYQNMEYKIVSLNSVFYTYLNPNGQYVTTFIPSNYYSVIIDENFPNIFTIYIHEDYYFENMEHDNQTCSFNLTLNIPVVLPPTE